jgi:hypothetical protein
VTQVRGSLEAWGQIVFSTVLGGSNNLVRWKRSVNSKETSDQTDPRNPVPRDQVSAHHTPQT